VGKGTGVVTTEMPDCGGIDTSVTVGRGTGVTPDTSVTVGMGTGGIDTSVTVGMGTGGMLIMLPVPINVKHVL
jgi:hypothetical protein